MIPKEVFKETISQGKSELYEDAFKLEEEIKGRINIYEPTESFMADKIAEGKSLGKGEKEVLHLFFDKKADAIISDDRSFLNLLEDAEIPFFNPANAIVELTKRGKIKKEEGLNALDRIKGLIRKDVYEKAKKEVEI
ncbi:MAG: hypothetical protein AAB267_06650 [Candidatus Desantisbacteria bacterium]